MSNTILRLPAVLRQRGRSRSAQYASSPTTNLEIAKINLI